MTHHSPPGQLLLLADPHSTKLFLDIQRNLPCPSLCLLHFVPVLDITRKRQTLVSLHPPYLCINRILQNSSAPASADPAPAATAHSTGAPVTLPLSQLFAGLIPAHLCLAQVIPAGAAWPPPGAPCPALPGAAWAAAIRTHLWLLLSWCPAGSQGPSLQNYFLAGGPTYAGTVSPWE